MRFRAFDAKQPWSVFYIQFATGALPIVVMRRILSHLVVKRQQRRDQQSWQMHDLLFITNFGESDDRQISFAHFTNSADGKSMPTLKVLGWDGDDTKLRIDDVERRLKSYLTYPDADVTNWPQRWANAFTLRPREVIKTTKELSVALARLARDIRARLMTVLQYETDKGPFTQLMKSFQTALIQDLKPDDFADMYAQTISYGLLSTRIADPSKQSVDDLAAHLQTNPFLRELLQTFLQMGGRDTHMGIDFDELGINEVIELLNQAQMDEVLRDFNNRNAHEDPVIHFYELFLKEYDAKKRMQRGVFYTPRPVVSYIVRSVHELLQTEFGLADGLAATETWADMQQRLPDLQLPPRSVFIDGPSKERIDPATPFVQVLDPATGTGTFLVEVIDVIYRTLMAKWSDLSPAERTQRWNAYVPQHLLPRLFGYELMMAPYTIAHLKIGLKLVETGYVFAGDQRANIYLTNALEPAQAQLALAGINPALAHEAQAVNTVKLNTRFTVVVGNPPYANYSANLSAESRRIVDKYRYYRGRTITERNQLQFERNIQDDFVKFISIGQNLVSASKVGILSYVTNGTMLASTSLRGLREKLVEQFNLIYELNLHGGSNEIIRGVENEENVFDIVQSVAIHTYLCSMSIELSRVRYADLIGTRVHKYSSLLSHTVNNIFWKDIVLDNENFGFILQDDAGSGVYSRLDSVFIKFGAGIKTNRDAIAIAFDDETLLENISKYNAYVIKSNSTQKDIFPILYRPFDIRRIFYHEDVVASRSLPTMRHVLAGQNIGFVCSSSWTTPDRFSVGVSNMMIEMKTGTHDRGTTFFPLYRYEQLMNGDTTKLHNFTDSFVSKWSKITRTQFLNSGYGDGVETTGPENVLFWFYCQFYSPEYRRRYLAKLSQGFPVLLLTSDLSLLKALTTLGEQLVALHLMESPLLDTLITHTVGSNWQVSKVGYADGTVWIDGKGTKSAYVAGTTGFAGVPEEVWNFHIGGYQVCEKWLKDRKGRTLTAEDIAHYQKIVVALHETIRLMAEIDVVIDEHGGWPGAFHLEDVGEAAEPARPQFGQVESSTPKRKAAEDKQQGSFLDE
jgi:predicted helicase